MKKIFAIALALVMVLSMASAFASYCTAGFDWTCATDTYNCGKATVDVIPYVKTNAACNGSEFVESDCAAAINGENVYYAIKLTVAEDVDTEWWAKVKFELDVNGMTKNYDDVAVKAPKLNKDETEDGWVYYYVIAGKNAGWHEATENDEFEIDKVMNKSVVSEFAKAKVCMTLKSASKGLAGVVGDYYVVYTKNEVIDTIEPTPGEILDALTEAEYKLYKGKAVAEPVEKDFNKDGKGSLNAEEKAAYKAAVEKFEDYEAVMAKVEGLTVAVVADFLRVYDEKGGKLLVEYRIDDGKVAAIDYTAWCGEAAYATIKAFFGLEIGTCVDADLIAANFGWDFEQKDCFEWSDKAASIVDAECVVAIPKTGDASVLAWLF